MALASFVQIVCGIILAFFPSQVLSLTAKQAAQDICSQFNTQYPNITFLPLKSQYESGCTENWSETAWGKPTCIVKPRGTNLLQELVRTLSSQSIYYAIRSGGHSPSPLAANIDTGVLIDLSGLNQIVYHADRGVVEVGTGLKWSHVYAYLDGYNVTVVGGRDLDVGVGGLILGGGLSYLSNLYGLVCDNVASYQIILANGSLIDANSTSHTDLFWALKGGANNFGIVTAFTLYTYPIHMVWGGVKQYSLDQLPRLLAAAYEFQYSGITDPYANFMLQAFTTNKTVGAVLNMVYLKPEKEPAAFAPFASISTLEDTTKVQTLTQMISGQMVPPIPRWDWFATRFTPSSSLYRDISEMVMSAPEVRTIQAVESGTLALGFQPISSSAITAGQAHGGNALGLRKETQTWFVLDVGWYQPADDATVHNATRSLSDAIMAQAQIRGVHVPYIFMNDASWDQNVIGHYGTESVERLKKVQRQYDPELIFQRLVPGGFKLP
ncbi:CAZyme family AA7 [Paecilomyces variotii]|nr:CAZyme family AA7 [Paecilomyces variotii]